MGKGEIHKKVEVEEIYLALIQLGSKSDETLMKEGSSNGK